MADEPSGRAEPPGHGPADVGGVVGCFGHPQPAGVGELVGGVADGSARSFW